MKFFTSLITATTMAAGMLLGTMQAWSAEYTLVISSWAPPSHGINAIMWPNLIKMIEEATDGQVTAEIKYGLAPPPSQPDLIQDGAADLTWMFHGYNPGRYTTTKMIELPGYEGSAEAASNVYWRAYEQFFAGANEHDGLRLVGLMTHGPGQLHSSALVTSLSEIEGMKLRLGGGVSGAVGAALGATGIRVPAPKVYETLASNAADGVMMPMESRKGFKLTEVAQNVYEMPNGFYRGSFAIVMNNDRFNSLPEDIRQALEEKVFGLPLSTMAGAVWDQIDVMGREATAGADGNSINLASAADQAAYGEIASKIIDDVMAEVSAMGIDAAAAHAFIASEMAAY